MAYTNLVLIFLILACIAVWRWDFPFRLLAEQRPEAIAGQTCIDCHLQKTPAIVAEWRNSAHGRLGVDCYKCHRANNDALILKKHLTHDRTPVSPVVTPVHCAGCHPKEAEQFARSKHANTHEIMWKIDHWLKDGMNNAVERTVGCFACHGTVVKLTDGRPAAGTWPNVGIGRINPDGSKGSCSACHTRHRFSIEEARRPEACGQCHAESWAKDHFDNFDAAVAHYNQTYYRPARERIDRLYAAGLLSAERYFDEPLEWEFYELWHHEGRRARMGAAMMAPDYAWWHGFYECKHRFNHVMDAARDLEESGVPSARWGDFPGRFQ